jgi:hypothetical protein
LGSSFFLNSRFIIRFSSGWEALELQAAFARGGGERLQAPAEGESAAVENHREMPFSFAAWAAKRRAACRARRSALALQGAGQRRDRRQVLPAASSMNCT